MVVKSRPIRIDDISQLERLPLGVRDAVFGDRLFCRHVNPGGGMGGFVESTARVGGRAIIENGACVLDRSQVYGYSTIHAGEQISSQRVVNSGTESIYVAKRETLKQAAREPNVSRHQ